MLPWPMVGQNWVSPKLVNVFVVFCGPAISLIRGVGLNL